MSHNTLALLTVPIVTGVIGYVTNWTGVLMLFYPVRFRGWRVPGLQALVRMLPHRLQQVPGVMVGGIGWQGIVPSRAAKMGSLAVDSGVAKIGRPREFFNQLEPEKIAEQIIVSACHELPAIVDGIMLREQPRLWQELPPQLKDMIEARVLAQLPEVVHELTDEIGEHIEQLVDVKLMVIKRFDPELANRVFLDIGQRELAFIKNFGFVVGFVLGIPVAILTHFVTLWWLLPILGVIIGYVNATPTLHLARSPSARPCAPVAPSSCARRRASTQTTGRTPPTPASSRIWLPTRGGSCGCWPPMAHSRRSTYAPPISSGWAQSWSPAGST